MKHSRKEFLIGFGSGLAPYFDDLPPEHRETLWKLATGEFRFCGRVDGWLQIFVEQIVSKR